MLAGLLYGPADPWPTHTKDHFVQTTRGHWPSAESPGRGDRPRDDGTARRVVRIEGYANVGASASTSATSTGAGASVGGAQSAVSAAEQRVATARQGVSTLQASYNDLQGQVAPAGTAYTTARASYQQLHSQVATERAKVTTARAEVATARTAVADASQLSSEARRAVTAAQGDVRSATADVRSSQQSWQTAQRDTKDAIRQRESAADRLSSAETARTQAASAVRTRDAAVDRAEGALEQAKGRSARADGKLRSAEQAVSSAQREVASAQSALANARARLRANPNDPAAKAAVAAAEGRLSAARGRLAAATSTRNAAKGELQAARAAEKQKAEALQRARAEARQAAERLKEMERRARLAKEELEKAKEAVRKAQEAERRAKDALDKAKEAAKKVEAELKKAREQLEKAEKARTAAREKLEKAQAALEKATASVGRLESKVEAAKAKMDSAKDKAEQARTRADARKQELDRAKARLATANTDLAGAKQRLGEAQRAAERARITRAREAEQAEKAAQRRRQQEADRARARGKASASTPSSVAGARGGAAIVGDRNKDGKLSESEEIQLLKSRQVEARAEQARIERDKVKGASIDAQMTPAERQRHERDQAALEERERQIRERAQAPAVSAATLRNLPSEDRALVQRATASRGANVDQQVTRVREQYFRTHDYYLDADGTAYAASVDSRTGEIRLQREEASRARGDQPATNSRRTATIRTDRSRTDVAVTATVPTGRPGETNQVRTETVNSRPDGTVKDSQIRLQQERRNADGSRDRSLAEENYDGRGVATSRVQERSRTEANGDGTRNRVETTLRRDGTTPRQTIALDERRTGRETTKRQTTTDFARDGVTRQQSIVASGTDPDGEPLPTTTARTRHDERGEPRTTFISRDGTLPQDTPAREYLTWTTTGDVRQRLVGGSAVDEADFATYARTGRMPAEAASGRLATTLTGDVAIRESDPNARPGSIDPRRWTRRDDNTFAGETLQGNLAEPLQPANGTPSVFDVPAALRSRASAAAIDRSPAATDPAAFRKLDEQQRAFEQRLAAADGDALRERLMRDYFGQQQYWIDRGTGSDAEPVLMASAWSDGAPRSGMFGASRAADPHATMARTGIEGSDEAGNPATLDLVRNVYVDGTRDDVTRTSYAGPAGASRVAITGEHYDAAGRLRERDRNVQSRVPRVEQGLDPIAITEVSRERFSAHGRPVGEQYEAKATSDANQTTLVERTDTFTAAGVIADTRISNVQQSRDWSQETVDDYVAANEAVIAAARSGEYDPNRHGTQVTVPAVGSSYTRSDQDIDYDATGRATFSETRTVAHSVSATVDEYDDAGNVRRRDPNGVSLQTVTNTTTLGRRGGTEVVMDDAGNPLVDATSVTKVRTVEFDPDDGTAGGNRSEGHQYREIAEVTTLVRIRPDGTEYGHRATPRMTQLLQEGHDDDWMFDEKLLRTNERGIPQMHEGAPIELRAGDGRTTIAADGTVRTSRLERDPAVHQEDLDVADKFEEFMEEHGSRIVMVGTIAAGVALAFTGVGSAAGVALIAAGLTLSGTQLAYTAINYRQGEASGLDLALDAAGVAGFAVAGLQGVRALSAANAARAGGAADDVIRAAAREVLDNPTLGVRYLSNGETVADIADGAMAIQAARDGDTMGLWMLAGALVGNRIAGRAGTNWRADHVPGGTTGIGSSPTGPLAGPAVTTGASPVVTASGPDAPAGPTGALGGPAAPMPIALAGDTAGTSRASDAGSSVGGARSGPIRPGRIEGSLYEHVLAENGWDNFTRLDGAPIDIPMRGADSLTAAQQHAIGFQTGLPHIRINPAIRSGATSGPVWGSEYDLSAHLEHTDAAIDGSRFAEPGRLYRGVRMDDAQFQRMLESGSYSDASYMSTSRNPRIAFAFPAQAVEGTPRRVVFAIDVAPGQRGLDVAALSSERNEWETLLPRNSRLEISDVRINADGEAIVRARLADPEASANTVDAAGVLPSRFGTITRADGSIVGVPAGNLDLAPGQAIPVRVDGSGRLADGRIESVADNQIVVSTAGPDGRRVLTTIHADDVALRQPHLLLGEEVGVRLPDAGIRIHAGWTVVRVLEGGENVLVSDGTTTRAVSTRALAPNPGEVRFIPPAERAAISAGSRMLLFESTADGSRFVGADAAGARPASPDHVRVVEGFERALAHHAALTGRPLLPDGRPLRIEVNEAFRGNGAFDVEHGRVIVGPDADIVTILHEVSHGTNQAVLGVDLMRLGNRSQLRMLDEGLAELRSSLHLRSFDSHHHPAGLDPASIVDQIRGATLQDPHHAIPVFQRLGTTLTRSLDATDPNRGFDLADDLVGGALLDLGARPFNQSAAIDEFTTSLRRVAAGRYGAPSPQLHAVEIALADSGLAARVGDANAPDPFATHRADRRLHHEIASAGFRHAQQALVDDARPTGVLGARAGYAPTFGDLPVASRERFLQLRDRALALVEPRLVVNRHDASVDYLNQNGFLDSANSRPGAIDDRRGAQYAIERRAREQRAGIHGPDVIYGSVQFRASVDADLAVTIDRTMGPTADARRAAGTTRTPFDATGRDGVTVGREGALRYGASQYGSHAIELDPAAVVGRTTFSSADLMRTEATRLGAAENFNDVAGEWMLRHFGYIAGDGGTLRRAGEARAAARAELDAILRLPDDQAAAALARRMIDASGEYNGYLEFQVIDGVTVDDVRSVHREGIR